MPDTTLRLDPEIIIGQDTVNRLGSFCSNLGRKVFLIAEPGLYEHKLIERVLKVFEDAGLEVILFDEIPTQATAEAADNAAFLARGARCDMVVGFGSIKAQYTARLAAIIAASQFRLFELLDGMREENACLPYVAIPSTWEDPFLLSDFLVAIDPRDRFTKLIKCPRRLCHAVILDSSLAEPLSGTSAPTAVFDSLCSSLEAYCSTKSSLLSDAFLEQAISLYAGIMLSNPEQPVSDTLNASIYAGLLMSMGASASAPGIGTALAYALNGKFSITKSWCSTVLLPYVIEKLIASRPEKMAKVASLMGEIVEGRSVSESANMTVDIVRRHMGNFQVPARLKDFNLPLDRLLPLAEAARNLEFVSFSPWTVASEDAYDLLKQAF